MSTPSNVGVPGALAEHGPGFEAYLLGRGYAPRSVEVNLLGLRRLSCWLEDHGLGPEHLTTDVMEEFVARAGHGVGWPPRARPQLLVDYLRACGAAPPPPPPPPGPFGELLGAYRRWLVDERGLATSTVQGYLRTARWFSEECCGGGNRQDVASLRAADVSSFVLGAAGSRSPKTVNEIVIGLRSFLRFLYTEGGVASPLAQATPWMARASMASLPRGVPTGTPERLLASCDRTKLAGIRDFAVLKLLVRLGLRAGEVAAMELGDLDWGEGQVLIRGKGASLDVLPLPVDVGQSIVEYLTERGPAGSVRQVFLHVKAPRGAMTMSDVRSVVREACRRCGLADTGTHRLRHGVATEMLRAGSPLHEIGQLLRHRDIKTTALYAKVDLAALASVAKPWPGSAR
jgi:site-specific recombinase XerD